MDDKEKSERINWSTLRLIKTSPKLLKHRIEHPALETAPLRLGRAIHCAILQPDIFPNLWITTMPCRATKKDGLGCGNEGKLFHDGAWFCGVKGHAPAGAGLPTDKEVITEEELVVVRACAEAVLAHPEAAKILVGGKPEHELTWTDPETGTPCRGRLDYLKPNRVVDLKSTRRETTREFIADLARSLYHGQLAWYDTGAKAAGQIPEAAELPVIIAVSTTEPYDVAVYEFTSEALMAGQIVCRDLLRKYLDCKLADFWPGIAPDMVKLVLPDWAPGMNGSEEPIGGESQW